MIKIEQQPNQPSWLPLRYRDTKWNTFYDPQDVGDSDLADVQNISYEKGYPSPRKGSKLKWSKPNGETNSLLSLFAARASDGTNYSLACYAPNFYFRDETNEQWIKLNNLYTPSTTYKSLMYGFKNWNAGVSSDVLYFGNGKEYAMKWQMSFSTLATTTAAADTTITLNDGSKFANPFVGNPTISIASPAVITLASHGLSINNAVVFTTSGALPTGITAGTVYYIISTGFTSGAFQISTSIGGSAVNTSGTQSGTHSVARFSPIVIKVSGGSEVYKNYVFKSTNTLTLSTTVGSIIASGAAVVSGVREAPNVSKGKIFLTYAGRLVVANQDGGECTLAGSAVGSAESFTPDTTATGPFLQVITDGAGGIVGVDNFGEYLLVEKEDSLHKLGVTTSTDSSGASYKRIEILPVAADISLGPVQPWARIKKNNLLYFATATEGIYQVDPDITGSQMSVKIDLLSQDIKPYVETLGFANTRTASFNQKILWSSTSNTTGDVVVVFDISRKAWTKYTNWNVRDWLTHNKKLLFGSRVDDNIYECFTDTKIDNQSPFVASLTTKAFDFGQAALPKTTGVLFASGYISPAERLRFDLTLTTGSDIVTLTYEIKGNGNLAIVAIPPALAMAMLGVQTLGDVVIDKVSGIFRAYLAVPSRYGFYTLQVKVYSSVNGTDWGFTGLGFAPWMEVKHPSSMEIGVISDPTNDQDA